MEITSVALGIAIVSTVQPIGCSEERPVTLTPSKYESIGMLLPIPVNLGCRNKRIERKHIFTQNLPFQVGKWELVDKLQWRNTKSRLLQ